MNTGKKQKFSEYCAKSQKVKDAYLNSGHVWMEDEDGEIEEHANDGDWHNGPKCIVCGYDLCWHCNPEPPKSECYKEINSKANV